MKVEIMREMIGRITIRVVKAMQKWSEEKHGKQRNNVVKARSKVQEKEAMTS